MNKNNIISSIIFIILIIILGIGFFNPPENIIPPATSISKSLTTKNVYFKIDNDVIVPTKSSDNKPFMASIISIDDKDNTKLSSFNVEFTSSNQIATYEVYIYNPTDKPLYFQKITTGNQVLDENYEVSCNDKNKCSDISITTNAYSDLACNVLEANSSIKLRIQIRYESDEELTNNLKATFKEIKVEYDKKDAKNCRNNVLKGESD